MKPAADYACYPAFPVKETSTGDILVPAPRSRHAACARGKYVLIHGGSDASGNPIEEDACIWLWDSETLSWAKIHAVTQIGKTLAPRDSHEILLDEKQDFLILHGGRIGSGSEQKQTGETWLYDFGAVAWSELPSCPSPSSNAALVNDTIYSIGSDASDVSGSIHILKLGPNATERSKPGALQWTKADFPTSPLAPGPRPRVGGALVPISTGMGRNYLVYLFGCREHVDFTPSKASENEEHPFYSDIWSLQLPTQGFNPASIKDALRDHLPGSMESGSMSWAEVEIMPTEQTQHEGKVHPGPRGFFGASPCLGGKGVVLWGGVNANKQKEADGWMLNIK